MRICSFIPSATEIVFALGLGNDLLAVSHECDYPHEVKTRPKTVRPVFQEHLSSQGIDQMVKERLARGESLYQLDFQVLSQANPDLILTQKLCDVCAISYREVLEVVKQPPVHPR